MMPLPSQDEIRLVFVSLAISRMTMLASLVTPTEVPTSNHLIVVSVPHNTTAVLVTVNGFADAPLDRVNEGNAPVTSAT